MPLQQTSGNDTADAFGGGAPAGPANYIEDVFSTWLYTGTGATQTITNGIDLSTKGGMVWMKNRITAYNNAIVDSARGLTNGNILYTNVTVAAQTGFPESTAGISAFNTTGFTLRSDANGVGTNYSPSDNLVSWTFRKQPKFFDVVTWTGSGANRTIAHNLGAVPGCIVVKRTDAAGNWQVYHGSLANTQYMVLNSTAAAATGATRWNSTTPTSTVFSLGTDTTVNASGGTYVAYLFAHNAGGFGLTGTDNVISCGSFTTDGSGNATVNLGYEPQWLMFKSSAGSTTNWTMLDSMRGWTNNSAGFDPELSANTAAAESDAGSGNDLGHPTSTGFTVTNQSSGVTFIYIAIRRGPMKVPTDGTKVFLPATPANDYNPITTGFPADMAMSALRGGFSYNTLVYDRLRGQNPILATSSATAEVTGFFGANTGFQSNTTFTPFFAGTASSVDYIFRRAPSFFDEVCYTGNGDASAAYTHNLTVVPELMLVKNRSNDNRWFVYSSFLTATSYLILNTNEAAVTHYRAWYNIPPTSTTFTVSSLSNNATANNYVNYLFATVAGVSKVGNYTGNGTTQTINCGFAGGARFVLIKRTDATGDWYVYDTARGMTTLTDPYLLLNSTAAESATLGSVTTVTTGFAVNAAILAAINTNAASYIFLAIS